MGDWGANEQDLAQECCFAARARTSGNGDLGTRSAICIGANGRVGGTWKLSPLVVDALASLAAIAIERHQSFEKEEKGRLGKEG